MTVADLVKQGDLQDSHGQTRAALASFRGAEQLDPRNPGVLLRIAKQYSDLIAETKPLEAAKAVADKALDYSRRAVELDPLNAKARLSVAISYGRLTDFVGNREKLEYSKVMKSEAQRALDLDPSDDFAWHVMGRWHFGVANVNPLLRAMAKLVYGGMPEASNEEAARYLRKACEIAPQRIVHHSELARVYQTMGKRDLAVREWQTVLALPALDHDGERGKRDAQAALGTERSGPTRSAAR